MTSVNADVANAPDGTFRLHADPVINEMFAPDVVVNGSLPGDASICSG
jgi:hypothetical protein